VSTNDAVDLPVTEHPASNMTVNINAKIDAICN